MSSRGADGFTLLEVLVAVFIMALVISFAYQAYQGIETAYARIAKTSSRDRAAHIVLDRIERELTGAVLVQREAGADPLLHPYFFFAEPQSSNAGDGFELRFVTQTPLRSPGSHAETLALVTYSASPSPEGEGLVLLRQEEPLPAQLAKQVEWTSAQTVADNVASFVLHFSGDGGEPVEGWDSTTVEQLDQLPKSIEIVVTLWEADEFGKPWPGTEFSRLVNLPVRPFRLAAEGAEKAAGDEADCGEGMTVTACLAGATDKLGAASPSLSAAISETRAQVTDACWGDPQPSPALQRLKVLLNGLPGFDAGECR